MPGLNKTPEERSNLEWAVNCTDVCARPRLGVHLSGAVAPASEAGGGPDQDQAPSAAGPSPGFFVVFFLVLLSEVLECLWIFLKHLHYPTTPGGGGRWIGQQESGEQPEEPITHARKRED